MKIGILTYNRTHNYGAVLQCYALQQTLVSMGYEVSVINYKQPFIEKTNSFFSSKYFLEKIRHPKAGLMWFYKLYIKNIKYWYIKCINYKNFRKKFLKETKPCDNLNIPTYFDIYLIGSDQLWTIYLTQGFDKTFFGDFEHGNGKIYSYAISLNKKSINEIGYKRLKKYVPNFNVLSFRERKISEHLMKEYNIMSRCDIDPTLLADKEIWNKMINNNWKGEKYIALYQARYMPNDPTFLNKKANDLRKQMGDNYKIVDINSLNCSPEDFLSIIKYSRCVITTSFHGVAFSIIFEKPLIVYRLNDGHDGRCIDLLEEIGAKECILDSSEKPYINYIDYTKVKIKIDNLRKESLSYLYGLK